MPSPNNQAVDASKQETELHNNPPQDATDPMEHGDILAYVEGTPTVNTTSNGQVVNGSALAASAGEETRDEQRATELSVTINAHAPERSPPNSPSRPQSPNSTTPKANGDTLGRKRSRSGSIIRSTSPPPPSSLLPVRPRETPVDKILLEQYVNREFHHSALMAWKNPHQELLKQKRAERDYYLSLQHERRMNPGAIFGYGYEGYGNARTDLKSQHPQLLYPSNRRRPGGRKSKDIRISRDDMLTQAEQLEDLVPIRLDIDWDKIKLRDTFTWNLHDRVTSPDVFAEKLVEDLRLPLESCGPLVRQISQSIQDQLADFYPQVFMEEENLDPHLPYHAYKNDEMRILVKLNITLGQHTLVDQFEWEINNLHNSPEEFAVQMTKDLSLPGEFTTAIAHSIREQVQLFTKSLYILSHPFDGRPIEDPDLKASFQPSPLPSPFRPFQSAKDFTPYLYELNEAELERTEVSISREQRRQKRSVNRRGGPALPDLKDRQRTIRTLVVSSVIPGAASSIEESRLFKRSRTNRSRRAAAGQRDGGDESDDSESDESSAGSPAISHLAQGTARTRGMRGAASVAQAAMRANLVRSATPEVTSLEQRAAARHRDYRDESSDVPDKLIVKLKINRDKFRQFLKDMKSNKTNKPIAARGSTPSTGTKSVTQTTATTTATATATATTTTAATTAATGTRSSMGPPQSLTPQPTPPKRPTASQLNGVIDAPLPPQPGVPGPSPPSWLVRGLNNLKRSYPRDSFEGTMRYTAVDPHTGLPLANAATTHAGQKLTYKYFPRIRCHDCPGKLYTPGPAMTVDNFEVHLKNRQHKERVEERHAKAAAAAGRASTSSRGAGKGGSAKEGAGNGGDSGENAAASPPDAANAAS
ncbi:transcription factor Snf5p [Histoplasma capsulatum var. duboisii H88]|uniref:Transcription factor Snf5p n=1 Tax=Ajellomyces capsulatus (strain H88) TaxID=544711 RepID=A0A8A1L7L8_AJEC8|nr:transcription factor Snf5p [Histoplasma capsulatum var. duboisii H88]